MFIKAITNNLFDCFDNPGTKDKTGFEEHLWVRIFKTKAGSYEYVKGNRKLFRSAIFQLN